METPFNNNQTAPLANPVSASKSSPQEANARALSSEKLLELSFKLTLGTLKRFRILIAITLIIAAIVAVKGYTWATRNKPIYSTQSSLLYAPSHEYIRSAPLSNSAVISLIKSIPLNTITHDIDPDMKPYFTKVDVKQVRGRPDIITITINSKYDAYIYDIATAYTYMAIEIFTEYWEKQISSWEAIYADQRPKVMKELDVENEKISALMRQTFFVTPTDRITQIQQQIAKHDEQADLLRTTLSKEKIRLAQLDAILARPEFKSVDHIKRLQLLQASLDEADEEIRVYEQKYTPKNPKLKMSLERRESINKELDSFKKMLNLDKIDPSLPDRLAQAVVEKGALDVTIREKELDLEAHEAIIQKQQKEINRLSHLDEQYSEYMKNRERLMAQLRDLDQHLQDMHSARVSCQHALQVLSPSSRVEVDKLLGGKGIALISVATLVATSGVCVFILLCYAFFGRVRSRREIHLLTGIPGFIRIPNLSANSEILTNTSILVNLRLEESLPKKSISLFLPMARYGIFTPHPYASMLNLAKRSFVFIRLDRHSKSPTWLPPTQGFNALRLDSQSHATFDIMRKDFILPSRLEQLVRDIKKLHETYDMVILYVSHPVYGKEPFLSQLKHYVTTIFTICRWSKTPFSALRHLRFTYPFNQETPVYSVIDGVPQADFEQAYSKEYMKSLKKPMGAHK